MVTIPSQHVLSRPEGYLSCHDVGGAKLTARKKSLMSWVMYTASPM